MDSRARSALAVFAITVSVIYDLLPADMPTHSPTGQKQSLAVGKIGQKPFFFNTLAEKIEGAARADGLVGAPEPRAYPAGEPALSHFCTRPAHHSDF